MMRQQHVGTGFLCASNISFGRIERTGNAGNLGSGISHGEPYMIPTLGVRFGIACQQRVLKLGDNHAAPTIVSSV